MKRPTPGFIVFYNGTDRFPEKARAVKVTIYEFDAELHDKTMREAGWEEGIKEGREEEHKNTLLAIQRAEAAEAIVRELEAKLAELRQ